MSDTGEIAETILRLCADRGPGKSICPSEVARALAGNDETAWRPLLRAVRREAFRLAAEGRILVLRKGREIAPAAARGVIRLRIAAGE